MVTLLKDLAKETNVTGKVLDLPDAAKQRLAAEKLSLLLSQADEIGRKHADYSEVETRAISLKAPKSWLAVATGIVAHFLDRLREKVQDVLSSLDFEAMDESDIEDALGVAIEDFAGNAAEVAASYEIPGAIEQAVLESFQEQDVPEIVSIAQEGACKVCSENAAAGPIPIGTAFPSGHSYPPYHGYCRCSLSMP